MPRSWRPARTRSFTVRGANIQDPLGHRFIVRGAVIAPGRAHRSGRHDRREGARRRARTTRSGSRRWASTRCASTSPPSPTPTSAWPPSARRRRRARRAPRRHPLGARRHRGAGAHVRQLPRREVPQGPLGLAAARVRSVLRRRNGRSQPLHLVVGLARRAARARACDPQRGHALADPALDAAPLGRPPPARALPPDRQGARLRRALPRRAAHQAHASPTSKRLGKLFAGPRTRKFAIIVDDLSRVGPSGRVDRPGWSDDFTAFVDQLDDQPRRRRRHRRGLDALRPRRAARAPRRAASRASARSTPRASSR